MSSIMDENKQERKWLVVEYKVLNGKVIKWVKGNSGPPRESP
jgi:hypothetical protein